jgi:outer membrane protein insertion porin family
MYFNHIKKIIKYIAVILTFTIIIQTNLYAKNQIIILDNNRISNSTILSLIDKNNLEYNKSNAISESLKKLYSSKLFEKIDIQKRRKKIIITIKENPLIADIKIIGNKKISDEILQKELSLKKREIFNKSKLESDVKRINEIYIKSGRFLAKITPKIIIKEQNRIEVIFEINEGKKAKIKKINFYGNNIFSDNDLKDVLSTKESKWYKFLSSMDVYDSNRVEYDKEKLRIFYHNKGYADFSTISSISQINKKKNKFTINFLVNEGIKFKFGSTKITNFIAEFDNDKLRDAITIKKNKIYQAKEVDASIDKMLKILYDKSYAFAQIEPVITKDREQKIINVNFVIKQTPHIYIRNINIAGNNYTRNYVILRELKFKEGDPYNINKINRSKQLLMNLGFFEKVDFDVKRVSNSNQIDLIIAIKERKTGEVNLGLGYSTIDKLTTNIGIRERNLFGTGQELGVNLQKSYSQISSEINYLKPHFLDYPITAGFDIFNYELDGRNTLVYSQNTKGFSLKSGYKISEYLSHNINYSFRDQEINNISQYSSFTIKNLEGKYINSSIRNSFLYDKRDNIFNTKSGYFISLSFDYSGIGGDIKQNKYEASSAYYQPIINDDFIFKFSAKGGVIDGIGQDVKSNYGFFMGGNDFRGFEYAGIGPRAKINNSFINGDTIGGKIFYFGSLELMFPLGLPKEFGINGILFSDNGSVFGVDNVNKGSNEIIDNKSIRSSYGLSIAWSSPMGPIRLDFSKIAKKEYYDRSENFRFSFGTNF